MYKVLFIIFLFLIKLLPASGQTNWLLSEDKNGIKIYTAIVPDSKIKAVKVICEFKATPSALIACLLDVNNSKEWVYHTKLSRLVKQVSPSELYYYSEVTLPWPVQNRDFVAHLKVTQNPATKVVTMDGPAVPGVVPVKKGIIRIEDSKGKWTITPIANNEIRVEYMLHVDPGGTLPAWVVNTFATEGPMQIFKNLKLELEKPVYKNAVLGFVVN